MTRSSTRVARGLLYLAAWMVAGFAQRQVTIALGTSLTTNVGVSFLVGAGILALYSRNPSEKAYRKRLFVVAGCLAAAGVFFVAAAVVRVLWIIMLTSLFIGNSEG